MNKTEIQKYVDMQRLFYNELPALLSLDQVKNIISWNELDNWSLKTFKWTEDFFLGPEDYTQLIGLEFGCGIGRLLKALRHRFKQLDGVDISETFLKLAKEYGVPDDCKLILCNGYDLSSIEDLTYNFIYSGWVMEHICVYEIRHSYFKEFYRVLKPGGRIVIQMCGGRYLPNTPARAWHDNYYDAPATNSYCDVRIDNLYDVFDELSEIGYQNISFHVQKIDDKMLAQCVPPEFSGHQYTIRIKANK